MLSRIFPDEWIESTYKIDFQDYYDRGYRGLIFDIDNTLVPHGADADSRAISLFKYLKELGFEICLLSNNKKPRVERFNKDINVQYIFKAGKPYSKNYYVASMMMRTSIKSTIVIGDQLFTDIYGGKLAGIHTILVNPIDKHEEIQIVLKRWLEKPIMFLYKHILKEDAVDLPKNRKPLSKTSKKYGRHFRRKTTTAKKLAKIESLFRKRYADI